MDKEYQLIVFRFKYAGDLTCLWPVYFELNFKNNFGQLDEEFLKSTISEIESHPGFEKVEIIFNKKVYRQELNETFQSIFSKHPEDDSVTIKYFRIETQTELYSESIRDYDSNPLYIPVQIRRSQFYVRVQANNFKSLLDELELPIIVIKEQK